MYPYKLAQKGKNKEINTNLKKKKKTVLRATEISQIPIPS